MASMAYSVASISARRPLHHHSATDPHDDTSKRRALSHTRPSPRRNRQTCEIKLKIRARAGADALTLRGHPFRRANDK